MKLKYDVFPDFYKKHDWLAESEDKAAYFTGRKYYLKNFWRNLCGLVDEGPFPRHNKTFIGQRKMGKTAFLVRCYNLAFWEQDEVIPFYYCFPQTKKLNLRETAENIAFKLLQQAIGYITKNQELMRIKSPRLLLLRLGKLRETDLILDSVDSEQIMNFSDHVLPVVMTKIYQRIFLGNISKATFAQYQKEWMNTLETRINRRFDEIDENIDELKEDIQESTKERKEIEEITFF